MRPLFEPPLRAQRQPEEQSERSLLAGRAAERGGNWQLTSHRVNEENRWDRVDRHPHLPSTLSICLRHVPQVSCSIYGVSCWRRVTTASGVRLYGQYSILTRLQLRCAWCAGLQRTSSGLGDLQTTHTATAEAAQTPGRRAIECPYCPGRPPVQDRLRPRCNGRVSAR